MKPGQSLNDLKKGAMARKFPFNPEQVDQTQKDTVHTWQYKYDSKDASMGEVRNQIKPEEGAGRMRFLNKLGKQTQARKASDGGREFLLHRGMSVEEHGATVKDGGVTHTQNSSWAPKKSTAETFQIAHRKEGNEYKTAPLASAWIHEKHIVTVPKQYGKLGKESYMDTSPDKGQNYYHYEHEVVVAPHKSALATPKDLAPTIHDSINTGKISNLRDGIIEQRRAALKKSEMVAGQSLNDLKKGQNGNWKAEGYEIQTGKTTPRSNRPFGKK
jgi:hypothetical protein